jgi:DNA-binding transcriptional MerR regulator
MLNDKPTYNIKVVLKETGIKADVLRAWERRYGLPMPQRSPGGHRQYSQRDIATIKWLIARQKEGLSISNAVEHWKGFEAEGRDPLGDHQNLESAPLTRVSPDSTLDVLRNKWLSECKSFNESAAEQILNQAFSLYPIEMVVSQIMQSGLRDLGELWFNGDTTVQQEHFTSALALRRMETLISATPPPTQPQTILLACPTEEWHTFSLVVLNLLLRRKGYHVVFLGANVPSVHLIEAVENIHPDLVVLASQQLTSASNLQKTAQVLSRNHTQAAYGGRVFNTVPALLERMPAHFLGTTIEDSLLMIEQLLQSPRSIPKVEDVPHGYRQLAQEFIEKRSLIEAGTLDALKLNGISTEYLSIANLHFGNELASALELGNVDYLAADLIWLKGLLSRHNVPPSQLNSYLKTYGESLRRILNGHSALFTNWLDAIIE